MRRAAVDPLSVRSRPQGYTKSRSPGYAPGLRRVCPRTRCCPLDRRGLIWFMSGRSGCPQISAVCCGMVAGPDIR